MSTQSNFTSQDNNTVLVGSGNEGDFVHKNQTMASNEGFKNVSKLWYDKTMSIDDGLNKISNASKEREDISTPIKNVKFVMNDKNRLALSYDNREFTPTDNAINQISHWLDLPRNFFYKMTETVSKNNGDIQYKPDVKDTETMVDVFNNNIRRIDKEKVFKFRTYNDGTLRAMLTDSYQYIDNAWYLELINKFMPSARLSHWKGDEDTIFSNVIIPDTIRQESDSEFGGMISIGNSEIGNRRFSQCPSLFRAICMNGCIWDQTKGNKLSQVHRGEIDLVVLSSLIIKNIQSQIPLVDHAIAAFMKTKDLKIDKANDNVLALFATIGKENGMTTGSRKSQVWDVMDQFKTYESQDMNLYGVINAVTRAGQNYDGASWVSFDEVGGKLMNYTTNDWDKLRNRANNMNKKDLEKVLAL